jgi:hypothetical protein
MLDTSNGMSVVDGLRVTRRAVAQKENYHFAQSKLDGIVKKPRGMTAAMRSTGLIILRLVSHDKIKFGKVHACCSIILPVAYRLKALDFMGLPFSYRA